jgi:2-dehydro-3-deoxyphosphogluconate aldolase/(4S)-4-hydroxy-2-oxoglutarate aldolase
VARFGGMKTLTTIIEDGLILVFCHQDIEISKKVVRACVEGGSRVFEFTNRNDLAYQVFAELIKYCEKELPELILGAGSIVDDETASIYISGGANFIVGPVINPEIAKICNRRRIPYIPGCGSVSEISLAQEYGCKICKIFPVSEVGGPEFVRSVLGPMPWTLMMPTTGVEPNAKSISEWFKAGACCIGMGPHIITGESIEKGDFAAISKNVADLLSLIKEQRP